MLTTRAISDAEQDEQLELDQYEHSVPDQYEQLETNSTEVQVHYCYICF